MQAANKAGMLSPANRVVLMVTMAVFINYIDRGNLATAAPLLQDEMHLSASQLGVLASAFYFGYVPFMPATGWLAERYGAQVVLAAGVAIWSIATLATGFVSGFFALLALRILLGIGESVGFPCASKLIAGAVPVSQLGVANGVFSFGYLLGPAVGTFIGGLMMAAYGWRPVFIVFGILSLLWVWPLLRMKPAPVPADAAPESETPPSFPVVLKQRALWGASMGHFALNYTYYFILAWLPFYLVKERGFSITAMASIAAWAYLLNAVCALLMGWATDRWIRSGRSTTVIYKGVMGVTHVVSIACMAGMVMLPEQGSVLSLFLYTIISGCSSAGIFAIAQILAGPNATGRWVGIQNAAGNVAGLIAPAITGFLVDQSGHFELAFALSAAVNILGFIGWVMVLPRIAPIKWPVEPARAVSA